MKQDEKGGKRSADGVGESQHAGRWSGRATGDENSPRNLSQEKAQASQTRLGYQATPQLRRTLVDRASREPPSRVETRRSLSSRMKHEIHGRDLAVPPFPHHPTIERSAFDEKNYRPIFHNA